MDEPGPGSCHVVLLVLAMLTLRVSVLLNMHGWP